MLFGIGGLIGNVASGMYFLFFIKILFKEIANYIFKK